jgi:hypothetical protein
MMDVQDGHGAMAGPTFSGNMKLYRKSVSLPGVNSSDRRIVTESFCAGVDASKR